VICALVVLEWTENIDDEMAAVENFAPPRLEIMSDGRVIANATTVSVLTPNAINTLVRRTLTDLSSPTAGSDRLLHLQRQDAGRGQGREDISLWPAHQPEAHGTIMYDPAPPTNAPGATVSTAHGVQPLDARLPAAWKDAVDALNSLTLETLADGTPYPSAEVHVIASFDDDLLSLISGGELTKSTAKRAWPAGIPRVPAYQPGGPSTYGMQHLSVTGAGVTVARRAFVQYLHWPSTAQLYDDGTAGQHYDWAGIWRSITPGEENPSAIPGRCGEYQTGTPQTTS
jgi:hypothetical protein